MTKQMQMELVKEGDSRVLILTIPLNEPGVVSASGKSKVLASTHGNITLPEDPRIKIGVNIYTPV